MSNFAILRIRKHKNLASVYHVAKHHTREQPCKTADTTRSHLNKGIGASTARAAVDQIQARIADAQTRAKRKFRTDAVKCIEYMITASPEWWKTATPKQRGDYLNGAVKWLKERHGAANVVAAWAHHDERTPHLHVLVVPLQGDVLNAKHYAGGVKVLSAMQSDFFEKVGAPVGLARGIKKSPHKHRPVKEFWAALDAPAPKPSKADYAAAALGFKPEPIKTMEMQNAALFATRDQNRNLRKNAAKVQATAHQNQLDGIRLEAAENFAREGNSAVLEVIEARKKMQAQAEEIAALKAQVSRLTPSNTPTHTPSNQPIK